ncbi:hypothetical protein M5689_025147 [Euphorbia peplus]|nr:hypothetical protein M5689_025147 [Euphorbia peplus]
MLASTFEFINEATSSSLYIFYLCNFIIGIIFLASKTSNSDTDEKTQLLITDGFTSGKAELATDSHLVIDARSVSIDMSEECNVAAESIQFEINENVYDDDDDDDSDEKDDEFRRRVEEFIDKVNKGWKAEMLRTSYLVYP